MNLIILAVGTKRPHWVTEAFNQYAKHFGRKLQEIKPEKRHQGINAIQGIAAEEVCLNASIPIGSCLTILDEHGKATISKERAQNLAKWRQEAHHVCFVIDGADGLSPTIKNRTNLLFQLSNRTLSHGLVRVLLIEPLYRAVSILNPVRIKNTMTQ